MPLSPEHQTPEAVARLGVMIGYPTEHIVDSLVQLGVDEAEAGAIVARVQEANPW